MQGTLTQRLRSGTTAMGLLSLSGVLIVIAVAFIVMGLIDSSEAASPPGTLLSDVTIPRELSISSNAVARTVDGLVLPIRSGPASLVFQEDHFVSLELPVSVPSGLELASFHDSQSGIMFERSDSTLQFPLDTGQSVAPLMIHTSVTEVEQTESVVRLIVGDMRAQTPIYPVLPPHSTPASVEGVGLEFELHRLPADARILISRLEELDASQEAMVGPLMQNELKSWVLSTALRVDKQRIDNGDDIGEASLVVQLSDIQRMDEVAALHLGDDGRGERLQTEVQDSDSLGRLRFKSPAGLSTFVLMVNPDGGLPSSDNTPVTKQASPTSIPPTATPVEDSTVTPTLLPSPTATSLPFDTPTPSPIPSSPTPTSTSEATPDPTATVEPTPTATIVPTPTGTPSATVTPTPSPTSTPVSGPTPTPTPEPIPDERYAVIVHTTDPSEQGWFLNELKIKWFLDFTHDASSIPAGHSKLLYVGSVPGPSLQEIQDVVSDAPGSVWYVSGEPNRRFSVTEVVDGLHDLYEAIKEADPTAKITSPAVLNWDFTCNGCAGYQSGHSWIDEFRAEYLTRYGEEPPVDIWAIDAYPLDWWNLPTVDADIPIDQIAGLRQYLDGIAAHRDKPIWVTEFSLHWGYDCPDHGGCFVVTEDGKFSPHPDAEYQQDAVIGYLDTVYDWLEQNASAMNIEMWFTFPTFRNLMAPNPEAFAGFTIFDSPSPGAGLTPVGEFFRSRALQ